MSIEKYIPKSLAQKAGRQFLVAKKNSPHIFFVGGIVGMVASTVLACRATSRLSDTLDGIQHDIDVMKAPRVLNHSSETEIVQTEEWHAEAVTVYTKAGFKVVRLYGPSFLVGIIAVSALTGSHIQLTRRNTALMAAYAAVQRAYDEYRNRVRDEFGEEKELDIYHAAETKEITEGPDKGKQGKFVDGRSYSPYVKWFDEASANWKKDSESNRLFLLCQQNIANDLLTARGHLFLNEVYDMLDVGRTQAGSVVGWVKDGEGDNYVNFGIYEAFNAAFANGHERSILLDFNVDGVIYDKI
jgi:hypothetical protein